METQVERVHADESLVKDERDQTDTSPLLYVSITTSGPGAEIGRTFRAED